ncbi:MAG TPA: alpha/beta hydrolase-fold protein [Bryobacteraceae bacterium]
MRTLLSLTMAGAMLAGVCSAQKVSTQELLRMARVRSAGLEQAVRDTLGADNIQKGTAAAGERGDFVFAVTAEKGPALQINAEAPIPAFKAGSLWVVLTRLNTGTSYKYTWIADGKPIGGGNNLAAFGPDSYAQPGVPQGRLTGPIEVPSKIYPDVKANLWYYVPAQWDGVTPLPVQVWGDGQQFTGARPGQWRILETLDNLTAQKRIPLMVSIFVQAGTGPDRNQRSIEYDTVSDAYFHRLMDEIFPVVAKNVKMRPDAYSRAIQGLSSGAIMGFNAAFRQPDQFSRVLSWIGSYTALRRSAEHPEGGGEYPTMVRREAKRNLRVWLQDGSNDLDNGAGNWPVANIGMADALKFKGYDYHFSFGVGEHNNGQGAAELPEALTWLWRDYDPAKTSQEFVQDPAEKDQPAWRVAQLNRK